MNHHRCGCWTALALLGSVMFAVSGCRPPHAQVFVAHYGVLHEVMHGGSRESVAELHGLAGQTGIYAVGALEGLDGEITILDGALWLSRPDGEGGFRTSREVADEGAALLVTTIRIWSWPIAVELDRDTTLEELGNMVRRMARHENLRIDRPFPFLIEAELSELDIHIADGAKIKPGDTPEQHHQTSVQLQYENVTAILIGFHSEKHMGVFTHRDQTVHVHAVIPSANVTGHVDGCVIPAGAVVRLTRFLAR